MNISSGFRFINSVRDKPRSLKPLRLDDSGQTPNHENSINGYMIGRSLVDTSNFGILSTL